jgi:hypothetical protein
MRLWGTVFVLAFTTTAIAEGSPLYVSAGVGSHESSVGKPIVLVTSMALMTPDIDRGGTRVEFCVGGWYLRQTHYFYPGPEEVKSNRSGQRESVTETQAFYQAVKASWRWFTPPDHSPPFEFGLGLGLHEEWQGGTPLEFVPRLHASARFCLFPSRPASSFVELEAMPQLSDQESYGMGSLYLAKVGYAFRI